MRATVIDRYRRRVADLTASGVDMAALPDELLETLHEAIGFDAICSGTLDPSTLLPTTVGGVGVGGAGVRSQTRSLA